MAILSSIDFVAGSGDNLGMVIVLVDHDPVTVATDVPSGSWIIRQSDKRIFRKVDDGQTTNVVPIIDMDYSRTDVVNRTTTTVATANQWVDAVGYSWTTPTLKGIYDVEWGIVIDRNNSGGSKGVRLYNVTDAAVFLGESWHNNGQNLSYSCFYETKVVEFLNATKTFKMQVTTDTNSRSVGHKSFFIRLRRVQKETA